MDMAEYIFILGKNPTLSLAEIACYAQARMQWKIREMEKGFAVVELDDVPQKMISDLGGTIKIAKILSSAQNMEQAAQQMEKEVNFSSLFKNIPNKVVFGVSSYNEYEDHEYFSEFFKKKMKEQGIKAGYLHLSQDNPVIEHGTLVKKNMLERSLEVMICKGRKFYVGKTIAVHNPFEFQKRDVKRPMQRTMYSIPPRLCKIMVNMAGISHGRILDPFCGIGTILQEALLMGFSVEGRDSDRQCIADTAKNLQWLQKEYRLSPHQSRNIRVGDAAALTREFGREVFDAIVTEPYLGPALRQRPGERKAEEIVQKVRELYEKALPEMIAVVKPGKRIVIVSPCFKAGRFVRLDVRKIAEKHGARVFDPLRDCGTPHEFPFIEYEQRHKTGREINIIEKSKGNGQDIFKTQNEGNA